jgi:hypothetical protein
MTDTEIKISENDLSIVLTQKITQCTNLELQVSALTRAIQERDEKILELERSVNGEESADA